MKQVLPKTSLKLFLNFSGFTLVELIVAASISAIIFLGIAIIFTQNNRTFNSQQVSFFQDIDLNQAMTKIADSIKGASNVVTGYPIGNPTYLTQADSLVVSQNSIDQNGNPIEDIYDYTVIAKNQSNSTVFLKLFPDNLSSRKARDEILAKDVNTLLFTYLDTVGNPTNPTNAKVISYTLQLETSFGNTSRSASASGKTTLRNN